MNGIVAAPVESYLESLYPPRDPLLRRLEEQAARERIPICGPQVGHLLTIVAAHATRALELGTAIGYSTVWLARALAPRGGTLDTVEVNPERARQARANLAEAGVEGVTRIHLGAALEVLPTFSGPYDLIFVDAVKTEYPAYLDHARRLVRPGGWLVADNVLLSGTVAGLSGRWSRDDQAAVKAFTAALIADPAFDTVVLPLRDGVSLSVRR